MEGNFHGVRRVNATEFKKKELLSLLVNLRLLNSSSMHLKEGKNNIINNYLCLIVRVPRQRPGARRPSPGCSWPPRPPSPGSKAPCPSYQQGSSD